MPYTYREVKDMYDTLADAGVVTKSLPDWSAEMNQETGSDIYAEGLNDNILKQGSVWLDRLVEATGAPALGKSFGGAVGSLVGNQEAGERIGEGLARQVVDTVPMLLPQVGVPYRVARGAMGAMQGLNTYEKTGSVAAGVISGIAGAVMPGTAEFAEQATLKALGAPLVKTQILRGTAAQQLAQLERGVLPRAVSRRYAQTIPQGLASVGAGQVAAAGLGVGADIASQMATGQEVTFSPTEQLLNLTLGQVPFGAMYLTKGGRVPFGGAATKRHVEELQRSSALTAEVIETKRLSDLENQKTPLEQIPDPVVISPEELASNNTRLNLLRQQQRAAQADGTTYSEHDRQRWIDEDNDVTARQGLQAGRIYGATIDENTPRRNVSGVEVAFDPETGFRRIKVSDDPANGELAGKEIGYSVAHEPTVAEGTYSLPEGYHSEMPTSEGGLYDPVGKFRAAEQKLAVAKTNADMHDALVELNAARQAEGLRPIDDAGLAGRRQGFELGSDKEAAQSLLEQSRRVAEARAAGKERIALGEERRIRQAELEAANASQDAVAAKVAQDRMTAINARLIAITPDVLPPAGGVKPGLLGRVVGERWTAETAPLKDLANENATTLTEGTEHVESRRKFLTFVAEGKEEMKRQYGMKEEDAASFMEQPEVQQWSGWLENSLAKGMDAESYGQRHLMAKGVAGEEAAMQTKRALELAGQPDQAVMTERLLSSAPISPEVTRASTEMQKALAANPEPIKAILGELGHEKVDDLLGALLRSGKVDPDVINMLPPEVASYLAARARDMDQSLSVLRAATDKRVADSVAVPKESRDPAIGASDSVHRILDADKSRQLLTADMAGFGSIAPANFFNRFINGFLGEPLSIASESWKWVKDHFKTLNNYIAKSPEGKEYAARAQQLQANQHKMADESLKLFGMRKGEDGTYESGVMDDKWLNALKKPGVRNAINRWMDENKRAAEAKGTGIKMLSADNPGVQRILAGLSDEDRQSVRELAEKHVESNVRTFAQTLEKMQNEGAANGAKLIGSNVKMKAADKIVLSEAILEAAANPQDQRAMMRLEVARQKLMAHDPSGETFMNMTEFAQVTAARLAAWRQFFNENPAWVTDRKHGKWQVRYVKGGKEIVGTAETKLAAQQAAKGYKVIGIRRNVENEDTEVNFFGNKNPPGLAELDRSSDAMLRWVLSPDEAADLTLPVPSAAEAGTDGDLFGNHIAWTQKNAAYWSRKLFKAQTRTLLSDSELGGRPDLVEMVKSHSRQMLAPDPALGGIMSRVTSNWLMGGNIASAMANATQLFTRGAAQMTLLTGKPLQSWKRMLGAVGEIGNVYLGKAEWAGEHKWVMDKFESEQGRSAFEFLGGRERQENDIALKLKWAMAHGRPQSAAEGANKLMHHASTALMWAFRSVEDVNNKGAMLGAFDHYRQQKQPDGTYLSKEQAYRKAEEFNWAVNDVGGKANRPIKVFETLNPSLAMLATSLQSYNIGTVGQIVNYLKKGFGRAAEKYTPAERYNARVALGQLMGTQMFLAGAMGLPFMGTALSLLNQAFPQWEIAKRMRETLSQLDEETEEYGFLLSDVAMSGIPSMFGWDMQSRLSMGNPVPGISEINGFQPELLYGPPGSIFAKFVKGGQKVSQGDWVEGVRDMMPAAAGKIWQLYNAQGKLTDYNGKPIYDATPGEKVGQVLGFQPTRLTKFNQANRMRIQNETEHRRAEAQFNEDMGKRALDGRFGDVIQAINARAAEDETFEPRKAAIAAAKAAVEWQFPRDLRNEATRRSAKLLQYFPLDRQQPSEVQKQQLQGYILQHLGVSMKPRDMAKYAIMDRLKTEHPEWSRSELGEAAEREMRGVRRQEARELIAPVALE